VTIDELTKIASALGIKLTHAQEGTQMYQAWADRVVEADKFDQDILSSSNTLGRAALIVQRNAAIREANRYAGG
jgi:hypothetical protein